MHRRQQGITLIEVLGALAIGSAMLLGLSVVVDNSLEDIKGQRAALYQSQVAVAARKYLAANYDPLVTSTAGGGTVAVTVNMLKAGGFLADSFEASNVYGQAACLLVRKNASAVAPVKLDAIVATQGGQKMLDKDIPSLALSAGPEGGYISSASPATAQGASWQMDTTPFRGVSCGSGAVLSGTAADGGHLVSALFYDGPGQASTDFIYRDAVPSHPELNQMNTPLLMAQNALATKGASCGATAGIAVDSATRAILTCASDGTWKDVAATQWKDPVADYANLPSSGSQKGDVRMVTGLSRAFTYDGSSWVALAVDQNGNLVVPNNLTVQAGNVTLDNGSLNVTKGDVNAWAGSLGGKTMSAWDWAWTSAMTVTDRFNPGDVCHVFTGYKSNGTPDYWNDVGTIVLDYNATPIPMVCTYIPSSNTYQFRYMTGLLTR
jgi:hypothetical protein